MHVTPGYCWRCEKHLRSGDLKHCLECHKAEYCSNLCRTRDKSRHILIECSRFGMQTCNNCNKKGILKECFGCNNSWYCNKECQKEDWIKHKESCNKVTANIKSIAKKCTEINTTTLSNMHLFGGSSYFYGNTLATDFLQLDNNEWSDRSVVEADLRTDYYVLSAGCGDLRNTVLTAGSLPERYQGKLYVTLNDFDHSIMARNILFLFMLVRFADTEGIESSLTTIWYSLQTKKKEYDLIKISLDELLQMTSQTLKEVTKGFVHVFDEDLKRLCQVWKKWSLLECRPGKEASINLTEQKQSMKKIYIQHNSIKRGQIPINPFQSSANKKQLQEWLEHGLFFPTNTKETAMSFDNPTLTGQRPALIPGYHTGSVPKSVSQDDTFGYCIWADCSPFMVWDCIRVRESETRPCPSLVDMYHNYVTSLLQKVKHLTLQGRLHVKVSLANCLEFPGIHQSLMMPNYDRIFTSNLADYIGYAKLLQTFKLLLNSNNRFSVIVTETKCWKNVQTQANIESTSRLQQCSYFEAYFLDHAHTGRNLSDLLEEGADKRILTDYQDRLPDFIAYLRAQIMGGGLGIQPLKNVPFFKDVMKYHGMQMRDFRKELNRLVPFQYRMHARDLTLTANDNVVEWCLPHT